jgi:hypothetical protein
VRLSLIWRAILFPGILFVGIAAAQQNPAIRYAHLYPGATAGEKIAAAIQDSPAAGVYVDATLLDGMQTISNFFAGVTDKPATVQLGCGTYVIDTELVMGWKARLLGRGYCTEIRMITDPAPHTVYVVDDNVEVAWLRFTTVDPDGDTRTGYGTVHVCELVRKFSIHHNYLDGVSKNGITVEGIDGDVHNNWIINSKEHGVYVSGGSDVRVYDNTIIDAGKGSIHTSIMGIKVANSPRATIVHNRIQNPLTNAISFEHSAIGTNVDGSIVENNVITGARHSGVRLTARVTGRVRVRGNLITLFSSAAGENAGIYAAGINGHELLNNTVIFSNSATNNAGIRVTTAQSTVIRDNVIKAEGPVPYGILADVGTGHTISNNDVVAGGESFVIGIRTLGSKSSKVELNRVEAIRNYLLAADTLLAGP